MSILARRVLAALLIVALGLPPGLTVAAPASAQQAETPTPTDLGTPTDPATATGTPTEALATTAIPPESATPTETAAATETETPSPTATSTASASATSTVTPTLTPTSQPQEPLAPDALQVEFVAAPEQAMPGEEVTFVVTFANNGILEMDGVTFVNILPDELEEVKGGFEGFEFDAATRTLKATAGVIGAGESATLKYTVRLSEKAGQGKVADEAAVWTNGLKDWLAVEALLVILPPDQQLISLSPDGGEAGLKLSQGGVEIVVPEGALSDSRAIVIQDLNLSPSATQSGEPWVTFKVETYVESLAESSSTAIPAPTATPSTTPEPAKPTESLTATPTTTDVLLPTPPAPPPTATAEPGLTSSPSPDEQKETPAPAPVEKGETPGLTQTATASPLVELAAALEPTATATLAEEPPRPAEDDQVVGLTPVEAEFEEPVEMTISFDGVTDLLTLGADYEPFIVTLDEASGVWVRVPASVDREANTVTAEVTHFSTWGAGVGPSFPQNGANVLVFDSAKPDLFTGRSHFSIPIWTPPGRNGLAPSLALSYSSGMADGVLGDVQAGWMGMGWSVDSIEIARKITNGGCSPCGNGYYGYRNEFILTFQGIGGELVPDGVTPGRYHTKDESFLYIQLHNVALNNHQVGGQNPPNATDEWWEVVTRDGTHWRLGWNANSEQLAAMLGYPGSATGAWASLGYAGVATNVVAMRWRADQVTDPHNNTISFSYSEETRLVAGTSTNYDRASYLDTISYTGHTSGAPTPAYSVVFVRESRGGQDMPTSYNDWDNWDTFRLDKVEVKYGTTVVRTYDLSYTIQSTVTVLTSVAVSGGGVDAPTVNFTYTNYDNKSAAPTYPHPRLSSVANGWGATAAFTYGNDGRTATDAWYNWRVENLSVADGVSQFPMQTAFAYSGPCYNEKFVNGGGAGWCNTQNKGELIGYGQTTVTAKDFFGNPLAITIHKSYTDERRAGQEYETQNQDASSVTLAMTKTSYTVITGSLPAKTYYPFADSQENYVLKDGF